MDLKAFLQGELPVVEGRGFAGITIAPPEKPMIAAVEGYALAGGCEITLACDLIVAARDAKFGLPEAKRSLVAGAGGLFRLPQRIPRAIAMEYALTGEFFSAEDAHTLGPRQPGHRPRRSARGGARAGPQDHPERAARRAGHQEDRPRRRRLAR